MSLESGVVAIQTVIIQTLRVVIVNVVVAVVTVVTVVAVFAVAVVVVSDLVICQQPSIIKSSLDGWANKILFQFVPEMVLLAV